MFLRCFLRNYFFLTLPDSIVFVLAAAIAVWSNMLVLIRTTLSISFGFFVRRGKNRTCPITGPYGNIINHPPFRVHLCVQRKNRFCSDLPFSGVSIWVNFFFGCFAFFMVVFYFFRNMVHNMTKLRIDCDLQRRTRYRAFASPFSRRYFV